MAVTLEVNFNDSQFALASGYLYQVRYVDNVGSGTQQILSVSIDSGMTEVIEHLVRSPDGSVDEVSVRFFEVDIPDADITKSMTIRMGRVLEGEDDARILTNWYNTTALVEHPAPEFTTVIKTPLT